MRFAGVGFADVRRPQAPPEAGLAVRGWSCTLHSSPAAGAGAAPALRLGAAPAWRRALVDASDGRLLLSLARARGRSGAGAGAGAGAPGSEAAAGLTEARLDAERYADLDELASAAAAPVAEERLRAAAAAPPGAGAAAAAALAG